MNPALRATERTSSAPSGRALPMQLVSPSLGKDEAPSHKYEVRRTEDEAIGFPARRYPVLRPSYFPRERSKPVQPNPAGTRTPTTAGDSALHKYASIW